MAGMFKKLLTSAVAAKVIQEARKPQNQQKIKDFVAQMPGEAQGCRPRAHQARLPPLSQPSTAPVPGHPAGGAWPSRM